MALYDVHFYPFYLLDTLRSVDTFAGCVINHSSTTSLGGAETAYSLTVNRSRALENMDRARVSGYHHRLIYPVSHLAYRLAEPEQCPRLRWLYPDPDLAWGLALHIVPPVAAAACQIAAGAESNAAAPVVRSTLIIYGTGIPTGNAHAADRLLVGADH